MAKSISLIGLSLLAAACGALSGCGGSSEAAPAPPPPQSVAAPSGLSYPNSPILLANVATTPLSPTVVGTVDQYSVTPALPTGLALNASTGQISGTPSQPTATAVYTIRASNAGGSATFALSLTVEATRTTVDLPDVSTSPYQIHIVYAVPLGGSDRRLDATGALERSILSANNWMRSINSGNQGLRLDMRNNGQVDVSYFALSRPDSFYASRGVFAVDEMGAEIAASPLYNRTKIYLIYYEGTSTVACGNGQSPGHFSAIYLRGTPPGAPPCDTFALASSATGPAGYLEWSAIHEIGHNLGFVNSCATNYTTFIPGHTGDDPTDLMWARRDASDTRSWRPSVLDPGQDDYYGASVPGTCPRNMFLSAFLEPSQGTQLPVGF